MATVLIQIESSLPRRNISTRPKIIGKAGLYIKYLAGNAAMVDYPGHGCSGRPDEHHYFPAVLERPVYSESKAFPLTLVSGCCVNTVDGRTM